MKTTNDNIGSLVLQTDEEIDDEIIRIARQRMIDSYIKMRIYEERQKMPDRIYMFNHTVIPELEKFYREFIQNDRKKCIVDTCTQDSLLTEKFCDYHKKQIELAMNG